MNMDKQPLSEAVTFLPNYTGLNIVLDPKALADEGLSSASPVSLVVNQSSAQDRAQADAPAPRADLQARGRRDLDHQPAGDPGPDYHQDLLCRRPGHARGSRAPEPIADTILNPESTGQPEYESQRGLSQSRTVRAELIRERVSPPLGLGSTTGERPKVDMTPMIQLIYDVDRTGHLARFKTAAARTSLRPMDWAAASVAVPMPAANQQRQPGAIVPFFLSISLIIKHTAEVHEQVADLLRQLRRLQDLQVSVEVRFITVSDNFFEQIGVDFDFEIQSDAVGKHSTFAVPNPGVVALPDHHVHDPRSTYHVDFDRDRRYDGGRRRRHDRRRRPAARRAAGPAVRPAVRRAVRAGGAAGGAAAARRAVARAARRHRPTS